MPPSFKMTPFTAFAMLTLFTEKKLGLTETEFDAYWDEVVALLERANNEKYRLHEKAETEET